MSTQFLFWLVIGIGCIMGLWYLLAVKELAIAAAKKHCREMDVQFLDGSVVQCGFRLRLKSGWRLLLLQTYSFEFTTTGERRYLGWTTYNGRKRISMELQPHTFPDS